MDEKWGWPKGPETVPLRAAEASGVIPSDFAALSYQVGCGAEPYAGYYTIHLSTGDDSVSYLVSGRLFRPGGQSPLLQRPPRLSTKSNSDNSLREWPNACLLLRMRSCTLVCNVILARARLSFFLCLFLFVIYVYSCLLFMFSPH